jgi:Na+/H+ antiporter NhaC
MRQRRDTMAARPGLQGPTPAAGARARRRPLLAQFCLLATLAAAAAPGALARDASPAAAPIVAQGTPVTVTADAAAPPAATDARPPAAPDITISAPAVVLRDIPFDVEVRGIGPYPSPILRTSAGDLAAARRDGGTAWFEGVLVTRSGEVNLAVHGTPDGPVTAAQRLHAIPGFMAVVPPMVAIAVALVFHSVIPALFLGAWVGAWLLAGMSPAGVWHGLLAVFETHVRGALADPDHAAILLFSLMIGGMVGIISRNGGMHGVVRRVAAWAVDARRGQLATALMGVAIFFDDYANTLVVGNTMRPVTDRLRISREKLAFLVDATAAPIACIALVTTWVGYEVGLIDSATAMLPAFDEAPYLVYLKSVLYSFYPLLMLLMVFLVAGSGRDFGPMLGAERRARLTGRLAARGPGATGGDDDPELQPPAERPQRAVNAALPIAVLVGTVIAGLYATGSGDTLVAVVGSGDSYRALMWASLLAVLTAAVLSMAQRILTLAETVNAWYAGVRQMLLAMIILVLAWALGAITGELHAADYLASLLGDFLAPALVPAAVFVLAALTAFATGTSWGTMGILLPLVVPLAWAILGLHGMQDAAHMHILYSAIACVLAGAVWGDHCSPISDTTILSSMASGCDHIDHVRTQLPYALLVGVVALGAGTLPAGLGLPWWACLALGAAITVLVVRAAGRQSPTQACTDTTEAAARQGAAASSASICDSSSS